MGNTAITQVLFSVDAANTIIHTKYEIYIQIIQGNSCLNLNIPSLFANKNYNLKGITAGIHSSAEFLKRLHKHCVNIKMKKLYCQYLLT